MRLPDRSPRCGRDGFLLGFVELLPVLKECSALLPALSALSSSGTASRLMCPLDPLGPQ
jgi:hypothetical protein